MPNPVVIPEKFGEPKAGNEIESVDELAGLDTTLAQGVFDHIDFRALAFELAELVQKQSAPLKDVNSALKVDGQVVRQMLVDNRGSLVAQNMLQKGHGQDAAEKEIDALLKAMLGLESSSLQLTSRDKTLQVTLELKLR